MADVVISNPVINSPFVEPTRLSRPFDRLETGTIAVKVINHYGDEVLKLIDVK